MTEFIGFVKLKGGSGATTHVINFAKYQQKQGKNTLIIDTDYSTISATRRFFTNKELSDKIKPENEATSLFENNSNPTPLQVDERIWLIAGNMNLSNEEDRVKQGMGRRYLFFWAMKHMAEIQEKYDYVVFDPHNDNSMITQNVLLVADKLVIVADVDNDAMDLIPEVMKNINVIEKIEINPMTMESLVNAKIFVLGNKVKHVGRSHVQFKKDFEDLMKQHPDLFIGFVPDREMIHLTKIDNLTIFDLENQAKYQDASHRKFIKQVETIYQKICEA